MVSVTVHITVLLLLMLTFRMCPGDMDMQAANGGVMVSFGELDAGGGDNTAEPTSPEVEDPTPDQTESTSQPTSDTDPVVTNDQSDVSVKKTTSTKPKTTEPKKEQPSMDPRLKKALEKLPRNRGQGDTDDGSGDGRKIGKGGDPNAKDDGPGGKGGGPRGQGDGVDLSGFSRGAIPQPVNKSQVFQKIRIEFCVDKYGNLLDYDNDPSCVGCGSNQYLVNLTISTLKKVKFKPISSSVKSRNCGTFTVDYAAQ